MCPDGCIHSQYEYGGLDPDLSRPVGKYTMDMWQRLGIAQATMEYPNLLIFDEPMNGLDNQGVKPIRSVLPSSKEKDVIIILASHCKEDIAHLCGEVYEMDADILAKKSANILKHQNATTFAYRLWGGRHDQPI